MRKDHASLAYSDSGLARSFLWSLATSSLPVASAFVTSWIIARWAGPEVVGTVSWVMAFATACLVVGKFGIGVGVSRLASEMGVKEPGRLRELFRQGLRLRLTFTLVISLLCLLFARPLAAFFGSAALIGPIRIASLVILGASLYEYAEHFLVGLNRMDTVYRVRLGYHASRIALTAVAVAAALGAIGVLAGYCLAWVAGILAYCLLLSRRLPPAAEGLAGEGLRRRIMRLSIPLAFSGASVTVYSQMDKIMVGYFSGVAEVGQYAIARNLAEVSLFPVFAMIMTLRPALASRYAQGQRRDCARIITRTLYLSLVFALYFALMFSFYGSGLVVLVFSSQFARAGGLMGLFAWLVVMRSLGGVILPGLLAAEKTRAYAYLTTLSATLNFILNLLFIPVMAARGAVLATLCSYLVLLILGIYLTVRIFAISWRAAHVVRFLQVTAAAAATAVLSPMVVSTGGAGLVLLSKALFTGCVYAGLILLIGKVLARWSIPFEG